MEMRFIKRVRVTVTLPEATYQHIRRLAEASERTVPGYIRHLVAEHLYQLGLPQYVTGPEKNG